MPKDIVQYKKEILPSGKGSEVMTPYVKPRPTMPIQAGTVVPRAMFQAAGTVAGVALDWMKINIELEQHRQNVVAENVLNKFARDQIDLQAAWKNKYPGVLATPTALKERYDALDSNRAETIELQTDMNETTKTALGTGLSHYIIKYRLQSSNYIESQKKVVEAENIEESKKRLIFEIENGEKTVEQAEAAHKLAFQNNHGHPDLLKQHNLLFKEAYEKATKERNVAIALIALRETYIIREKKTEHGEGIMGAINEAQSNAFIKKHGADVQKTVLTSLLREATILETQRSFLEENQRKELMPLIDDGTAKEDDIRKTILPAWEQQKMIDRVNATNTAKLKKAEKKKKRAAFVKHSEALDDAETEIERERIRSQVYADFYEGKLDTGERKILLNRTKETDSQAARLKRYHSLLRRYLTKDELDIHEYGKKANLLDVFSETKPTDAEFETYFEELTEGVKGDYLDWLFNKMFKFTSGTPTWIEMIEKISGKKAKRQPGETIEEYLAR